LERDHRGGGVQDGILPEVRRGQVGERPEIRRRGQVENDQRSGGDKLKMTRGQERTSW
jgi:hypothetical protein